jgi:hypothetical protein
MSQPKWVTNAGALGNFASNSEVNIDVVAEPQTPASFLTYTVLNGSLPDGLMLTTVDNKAKISGLATGLVTDTTSTFTLRVIDEFDNFRDRTFSITITIAQLPTFAIPTGLLFTTVDSVYVDFTIGYNTPIFNDDVTMYVTSGSLPPGLYLDPNSYRILGYAEPPISINKTPITKEYRFTITLYSNLGMVTANYSISVRNYQEDYAGVKPRKPVIFNLEPPTTPVSKSDPYYDYYLIDGKIPFVTSGDVFSFKVIGHDFDGTNVTYTFGAMPPGLSGNSNTGWVTGTPIIGRGLNLYTYNVQVKKPNGLDSGTYNLPVLISNGVTNDVAFTTNSFVGSIFNNTISYFNINATSEQDLVYTIIDGSLPPNLELQENGEITGKVAFQPSTSTLQVGEISEFTFTVKASSPMYPLVTAEKTFSIVVIQYFSEVTESIYFKASPNFNQRNIINSLLTDTEIIPDDYLFRPDDPHFGKAQNITFVHAYGIKASTREKYIQSITENHYWRNVILGELKTAVARDDNGDIIYEVVYSEVIDDLVNSLGQSVPKELIWPTYVSLQLGPYITSEGDLYTSFSNITVQDYGKFFTSQTPGTTNKFYPASLVNMRNELINNIGVTYNSNLLPKWMATQQENGNVLGYVQAFVICYTKPGYSKTILNNINDNWPYVLNQINFTIDRYYVDRSSTYNYNSYLENPSWISLPSAYPNPDPLDNKDYVVLFPQKTIFPSSNN